MSVITLPYSGKPANGDDIDADQVRLNILALLAALNALDGANLNAKSVVAAAIADAINPQILAANYQSNYVVAGLKPSGFASLGFTLPSGTAIMGGVPVSYAGGSFTVAINQDTYYDLTPAGAIVVTAVTNNTASPALSAGNMRLLIAVSNGTAITFLNTGQIGATAPVVSSNTLMVTDSLGNMIYNTTPVPTLIGYRQITTGMTSSSVSQVQVTGLSCPAIVPANRRVKVTLYCPNLTNNTGGAGAQTGVWDGTVGSGTQIGGGNDTSVPSANGSIPSANPVHVSPSTGLHTYNAGLNATSGTANFGVSSTLPGFIAVELE